MDKVFLIDGHAQIFRMYYAFMRHPLINSKGIDTSILYGFTKMVLELLAKEKPTHIAVAFDLHADTFRHKVYKEYKANRPPAPELVVDALEPLREILKALNIPALGMEGYEADDVIGSMAKQWASDSCDVYMVTPDKDYGQLIDSHIYQYKFAKGSSSEPEIIDREKICAYYGISSPESVVDILTIWGDASDNVPGVKGIGEVGAKKLIGTYGNIDNLLAHIQDLPAKQQEKIREASSHLDMSRFLVTIKTDIDLPVALDQIKVKGADASAVDSVFSKYEFTSLKKMITSFSSDSAEQTPVFEDMPADDYPEDDSKPDGNYFNSYVPDQETAAEKMEIPSVRFADFAEFKGIAFQNGEVSILVQPSGKIVLATLDKGSSRQKPAGVAWKGDADNGVLSLLEDVSVAKTGCGLKETFRSIASSLESGREEIVEGFAKSRLYDIELLHYLINPEMSHTASFILKQYYGVDVSSLAATYDAPEEMDLFSQPQDDDPARDEADAKESILYIYLKNRLMSEVSKVSPADGNLYGKIEMPLIGTLARMELAGIKIDTAQLKDYSKALTSQMNSIEAKAKELAGDIQVNLSSPKQVGELLFEKLKISPDIKKTPKGSYPTDENTLRSFAGTHPIVGEILEYRNLKKLLSTYIDALPGMISPVDGKLHTTFNQALTATGRLSSNNPNLQNIPIRTERGREIRKAFVPSFENGYIVSADYSQIELRLMAHMSQDEHLIAAFNSGEDVHRATAARLFGVELGEVTDEMRRKAKTVNFGIIYGISAFGLAERMDIGVSEAKKFIENYFNMYPGVSSYIADTVERARSRGFVETIYGRRRYLKDINSRNANVRKFNERNAVNAPLQGSAADIIKIAMANVSRRMESEHLASRMVLQVHDELVFDVAGQEKDIVMQIAREEMESVISLKIKLTAECGYGKNWLEAH
ncbi:MAG: DNA polymerase I [Bacteroidales bacterium]|nr:DNA polymerase I [Bacteroidales bacterium]